MAAASADAPVYYTVQKKRWDYSIAPIAITITTSPPAIVISGHLIHELMNRLFKKLERENPPDVCPLGVGCEEHSRDPDAHIRRHEETEEWRSYFTCDPSPRVVRSADGLEITVSDKYDNVTVYTAVPLKIVSDIDSIEFD
uniref:Uncharacterized protein n=1 Tax=viral metagenome TaxID=1070528 RepID=A0A6C0JW60_9ZZZZ